MHRLVIWSLAWMTSGLCLMPRVVAAQTTASPAVPQSQTQATSSGSGGASTTTRPARPWGRIALFTNTMSVAPDSATAMRASDLTAAISVHAPDRGTSWLDYGLDGRTTAYSAEGRAARLSLYEAWAGARLFGDSLRVRGGHLWLTELGGLGAIAGGMVEGRRALGAQTLRVAAFSGREPNAFQKGYVADVLRSGGYLALDAGSRRHVVGYVHVRNQGVTERAVVTTTNYLPLGRRVFVYQAAEFDVTAPGGRGRSGLTYAFANLRVTPTSRVDALTSYHRGRSIDARTLTLDQINGRPSPLKSVEGLFFETLSGRVSVDVVRGLRVFAGYSRDRTNQTSDVSGRVQLGGHSANVLKTGIDATVTWYRIDRGTAGTFTSTYASVGRSFGRRLYLSGDYSASLATLRFTPSNGVTIETHPETTRLGVMGTLQMTRLVSLLAQGERTRDEAATEYRIFTGVTYRLPQ